MCVCVSQLLRCFELADSAPRLCIHFCARYNGARILVLEFKNGEHTILYEFYLTLNARMVFRTIEYLLKERLSERINSRLNRCFVHNDDVNKQKI